MPGSLSRALVNLTFESTRRFNIPNVSTYQISELAERSGIPATTLRYYEQEGLLSADRTPAGYRTYDEGAVDRLTFITSGKSVGLPLDKIRDLLTIWDSGMCADVRDRLRPLVAERITDARLRAAEMTAFATELTRVHAQLQEPLQNPTCGPDCGCLAQAERTPVQLELSRPTLTPPGEAWQQEPVACTLNAEDHQNRSDEWRELLVSATSRQRTHDGARINFPTSPELAARIAALAAKEQSCCAFFDFDLKLTPTTLVLHVRAPEAATTLVDDLFGATP